MKKTIVSFLCCSFPLFLLSQNWIVLGNDPSGDLISDDYTDLTEISFRVDDDLDSLWILLIADTTHFLFKPGFGVVMGLDTNLVADDGITNWGGANQSMQPDLQHTFVTNNAFPNLPPSGPGTKWISASKDSLILGFEKFELDDNGQFNVIFGTGIWDLTPGGMVYDEAPDTSFYLVNAVVSSDQNVLKDQAYVIFPNPAKQYLNISGANDLKSIRIFDINGVMVFEAGKMDVKNEIDISNLTSGNYLIELNREIILNFIKW